MPPIVANDLLQKLIDNFIAVFVGHQVKGKRQNTGCTGIIAVFYLIFIQESFVEGNFHLFRCFGITLGVILLTQQTGEFFHHP